ncbi:MAG: sigma-70 family RNA polymerase sigma factor [Planctomycetota bacterium]
MSLPDRPVRQKTYGQALEASSQDYGHARAPGPEVLDAELVQAALDGDMAAFEGLVARYERKAFWLAYHMLGQVEEARDVVQEAFVRVHRSLDRFDFSKNFYTWLYRIVTNLAIDSLRKLKHRAASLEDRDTELGEEEPSEPSGKLEGQELRHAVRRVLDQMHPRFRTILALRDLHDISSREIAPILGLTFATVRWRLHKARQLFREAWERETRRSQASD